VGDQTARRSETGSPDCRVAGSATGAANLGRPQSGPRSVRNTVLAGGRVVVKMTVRRALLKRSTRSKVLWTVWMGVGGVVCRSDRLCHDRERGMGFGRPRRLRAGAQHDWPGDHSANAGCSRESTPPGLTVAVCSSSAGDIHRSPSSAESNPTARTSSIVTLNAPRSLTDPGEPGETQLRVDVRRRVRRDDASTPGSGLREQKPRAEG
jgi:hypothetical protein